MQTPPDSESLRSGTIDVRLLATRYAARDINLYELARVDGKTLPAATAGAHIDLHLPNGLPRQYSLLAAETDPTSYWIGIKRDAASRGGSSYIHDQLRIGAPRNNFPLHTDAPHSAGKTILQVLRDSGLTVPSSCEQGVCGACETRIISGAAEHRDAILTNSERAANSSMMICCSGANSERLLLDL